jgi:ketosteroid isomerase-like protein
MKLTVSLLLATLATSAAAAAQVVSPGLERANPEMARGADVRKEVRARVEEFLKLLGNRDVAGVRDMLAPKALVVVVRQREAAFTTTYQTGEEFIAQFEKNSSQPKFEEPITNVAVTVDSAHLAFVRADFKVVRDGKVVSSGVDQFTLAREDDTWKIAVMAYTSLPAPAATR